MKKKNAKKIIIWVLAGGLIFFGLIQLVPYGKNHNNPPVTSEPDWDSPETRQVVMNSCFNCHSNETEYPWYSYVAPASWLLQHDIDEGRSALNFSEWDTYSLSSNYIISVVQDGKMPPIQYTLIHPEAKLEDAELDVFIKGIQTSLGK